MGEQEISAFLDASLQLTHMSPLLRRTRRFPRCFSSISKSYNENSISLTYVARVKRPAKIPVVFTREEARVILDHLDGEYQLMASCFTGAVCA